MKTALYKYLEKLEACADALTWVDDNKLSDPQVAWDTCPDVSWLLWIVAKHLDEPGWPTRREIVLAACECVELALHLIPADEARPRVAIDTARRWAVGEATVDECKQAGEALNYAYRPECSPSTISAAYYVTRITYTTQFFVAFDARKAATNAAYGLMYFGGNYKKSTR